MRTLNDLEKLTLKGKNYWEATSEFDILEFSYYDFISYQDLMQLNNHDFLKEIINRSNRNELNEVVEKFPAYDIAVNCLKNGHITIKQRAAITNVFLYIQLSWINAFVSEYGPW